MMSVRMIKIYWFRWANALSWLIRNKIKVVDSCGGDAGAVCTRGRVGHGDGLYVTPGKKELLHRTIRGDDCHDRWCAWGRRWHSEAFVPARYDSSIHPLPAHSHHRTVSPRSFCLLLDLGLANMKYFLASLRWLSILIVPLNACLLRCTPE